MKIYSEPANPENNAYSFTHAEINLLIDSLLARRDAVLERINFLSYFRDEEKVTVLKRELETLDSLIKAFNEESQ